MALNLGQKIPAQSDLLSVINGGSLPNYYGQGTPSQPTVDLQANAFSTPVKLLQKFVNDRGWGSVDVTGMNDWRGNPASNAMAAASSAGSDADKWAALSQLLRYYMSGNDFNGYNNVSYAGSSHDSTGAGGRGR